MEKLRIITLHNFYQQAGGEDAVFDAETALLEENGHHVVRYSIHNNTVASLSSLELFAKTIWNLESYNKLRHLLREENPDVIHVHNTLPLLSPSVYYAARTEGVPVVQSLHNYRLLCTNGSFFREGRICEDCSLRIAPWPGVVHACYRESIAASATVAAMLVAHRALGTWKHLVDIYIASTMFSRNKFIEGGLPASKIVAKPNFVHPDPGVGEGRGQFALFVGRFTIEKGIRALLVAWEKLGGQLPLKIVGDGPLAGEVRAGVERLAGVEWLGYKTLDEVYVLMGDAAFLVMPSEWFEAFGLVTIMAFAKGTPVVAARIGAVAEINNDNITGLQFRPGDPHDLVEKVQWLLSHPAELAQMRLGARAEYESKYTAAKNYNALIAIYERAISNHKAQKQENP